MRGIEILFRVDRLRFIRQSVAALGALLHRKRLTILLLGVSDVVRSGIESFGLLRQLLDELLLVLVHFLMHQLELHLLVLLVLCH